MKTKLLLSAFVALSLLDSQAAVIVTTADGSGVDTYLSNDTQSSTTGSDDAHGTETTIQLRYGPTVTRLRMPVLQFDLTGIDTSSAGWASAATLQFEFTAAQNNTRTIYLYAVPETLDQLITDSTAYQDALFVMQPGEGGPAYNSGSFQFDGGATVNTFEGLTLLDSFSNPSASIGVKTFSAAALATFLEADTDGVVLFVIGGPTAGESWTIAAEEHATALAPTLNLPNATVVPEPSVALLGIGGGVALFVLAVRRNRRC